MPNKALITTWVVTGAVLAAGCASSNKDGFTGPSLNMDEPHYDSSIERSKDAPQMEKETRVDFFKFKQGF